MEALDPYSVTGLVLQTMFRDFYVIVQGESDHASVNTAASVVYQVSTSHLKNDYSRTFFVRNTRKNLRLVEPYVIEV